jgi:RNA polymerase sigma factor (sigma-70 family)
LEVTIMQVFAQGEAGGRRRSLEDVYVRYVPAATRLAFLITGSADIAEDIAHDAFVRVAGRFGHLRQPDAFDAYLRRTVVNLCSSYFRRLRYQRRYLERQNAKGEPVIEAPDVSERDELSRALERLPVRQRAAIVLRYYEDLSENGVAETMSCSVSAARSLIARGMQTLRRILEVPDGSA